MRSIHIDDDQIISRHFSNGSIQTEDLTHNAIETYPTVALDENDPKILQTLAHWLTALFLLAAISQTVH